MNTSLAVLGIAVATGILSLCDLCETDTSRAAVAGGSVAAALGAPRLAAASGNVAAVTVAPARSGATAPRTVTLKVDGMTCGGCVIGTRTVLTRLAGVTKADVSYDKGTAIVTYDPAKVTVEQMIAAIRTLGYVATLVTS